MTDTETKPSRKLSKVKPEWMVEYVNRRMTSEKLAELSGYAAPYLRRAITRNPPLHSKAVLQERKKLNALRRQFIASIAHLPADEIMKQANVSRYTAARIKQRHGKT